MKIKAGDVFEKCEDIYKMEKYDFKFMYFKIIVLQVLENVVCIKEKGQIKWVEKSYFSDAAYVGKLLDK